ncbi:MAG: N-acetyl-gamma-glutamyl-phosphate reductase [Solirubrobacterales bacterium]
MADAPTPHGVAVLGGSGFAGALACELVHRHPTLTLTAATSRSDAGRPLAELYPRYRVPVTLSAPDLDRLGDPEAAIVAYPHGAAAPVVDGLRERGIRVVDLSADFRLADQPTYERWYGTHGAPGRFGTAAYGLPELHRDQITGAELVANPGCYPTASLIALAPLAEAGLAREVILDAKTGVSGAGRGGGDATHFVAIAENASPYKVDGHRHEPEIAEQLGLLGGPDGVTFIPHLLPLDQGELISAYVKVDGDPGDLLAMYRDRYRGEPFVEVVDHPPGMREVRDTNRCRLTVRARPHSGLVMVFAVIDNLWKGAASQAIQNLNLMLGLPEAEGLR